MHSSVEVRSSVKTFEINVGKYVMQALGPGLLESS